MFGASIEKLFSGNAVTKSQERFWTANAGPKGSAQGRGRAIRPCRPPQKHPVFEAPGKNFSTEAPLSLLGTAVAPARRTRPRLDLHVGEVAFLLQPFAAVAGAFFGQQHVHELIGVVLAVDGELHQAAGARVDRRL